MPYSIGEVSARTGIPPSTLRYYDREGMFPSIARGNGGIRTFSDEELGALEVVECLKNSGLTIKEIKQFLDWCKEGDSSLEKRRDFFYDRLEAMNEHFAKLQKTMDLIKYKCWYYDTAAAAGTESAPREMPSSQIPDYIRAYRTKYP